MTLVIAFIGESGAVMAGDMREITYLGDPVSMGALERELYTGLIATDEALLSRAGELGVRLGIRDDKVKVTERDGVLVGEVTSLEGGVLRKRRVYASGGSYAIVDTGDGAPVPRGRGGAGNFVVLGNGKTKAIAHRCIRGRWKNGSLRDAVGIINRAMERASSETPSVSRQFILVQTRKKADLGKVMEEEGARGAHPDPRGCPSLPSGRIRPHLEKDTGADQRMSDFFIQGYPRRPRPMRGR